MTRNTPRLLTILHFSQIFLTEERTFTFSHSLNPPRTQPIPPAGRPPSLFCPVNNSSPCQIIGRQLNRHPVARQDLDKMHPHLTGDMGQDTVTVFQFHTKHGIRQGLNHLAFNLYCFLFRHKFQSTIRIPPAIVSFSTNLLKPTEDVRSVFRNRYGMFKMGGKFSIFGDDRPAIGQDLALRNFPH